MNNINRRTIQDVFNSHNAVDRIAANMPNRSFKKIQLKGANKQTLLAQNNFDPNW